MPPALSARAIFVSGLTLTVLGIVAAFVAAPIAFAIAPPYGDSYATAGTIAGLVSEITLTLGLVLLGTSPLARMVENPPKKPDTHTVLLRDTLTRRAQRRRSR